jgi:vitamin B12 transporter
MVPRSLESPETGLTENGSLPCRRAAVPASRRAMGVRAVGAHPTTECCFRNQAMRACVGSVHMKIVQWSAAAVGLLASVASASRAGAADPADRAEEVIVTATRVEQPIDQVIGATTLITRQDIERRLVQSTQDMLRGQTGIDVVNTGGLGKLSNVFVRGADAEQVLVLVDGVRAGSATSGTTPFEYLPVDQIERIEIVRGPRSSLYGADAIGGVIQIFTRRDSGPAFSVGGGSHGTYDTTASFGMKSDRAWFSVAANRVQTEGYNACDGVPFPPGGGCFTYEPDNDGYDNTSGTMRAGYRWGDRAQVEATALYASGTTEFDGSFANETDFVERVFTLSGRFSPTEHWNVSLEAGDSHDDQDNFFEDPAGGSARLDAGFFDTEKRNASLQSDWLLSDAQQLTVGVDYVDDLIDSDTPYTETSRSNVGVFGQYQVQLGAHQAVIAARHDDNEQFGGYDTGSLGWKWNISPNLAMTAAWGTAFGAPTFNDLYYPGFSNPNLDPESSHSFEVGLSGTANALRWSLLAFENLIDDLIVFDASTFTPNNLAEARIRGIEADASATLGAWSLNLGYSAIDPRNRTPGPDYDNVLPRRARQSGHVEIGRGFGAFDARVRVTGASSRYDDVANTAQTGGYAVVDLVVDYAVTAHWSLQGKVGNLLDHDYQTVRYYNQDDRTYFVNVRYQTR